MNFTMFPISRILFFFGVLLLLLPFFGESNKSSLEYDPFFNFLSAIDPKNVLNISSSNVIIGSSPCLVNLNTNNNNNNNGVIIIRCNKNATNIVEIRLENLNLSGTIDADSLCKLQKLRALSLANNNIKGKIPHSILHCTRLMYLNLTRNQLSGNVPTRSLAKLKFLKKLDISNNNFIPIKHNKFSTYYVTPNIKDGTKGSIVNSSPYNDTSNNGKEGSSSPIISMKLLIPLILGLVILLISLIFAAKKLPKLCREGIIKVLIRSHQVSPSSQKSITSDQMVKKGGLEDHSPSLGLVFFVEKEERFTMEDLLRAAADLRSESFCSSLYKVKLNNVENDVHYAVKRLKNVQVSCEDEFGETLRKISKLKHPNILPLVGYRSTSEEKLVIYKYQTNGSLLNLLNDYIAGRKHFPWKLRLSIACGIARGMAFIYRKKLNNNNKEEEEEDDSIIPHGNLKPSNILLNENNEPLISEHGLTKFMDPNRSGFLLSSQGYTAPEKCISEKSDVYSFGVILLELLTGKSIEKTRIDLARWVRSMVREEWTGEVFDKKVGPNEHQWAFPILNVALTCVTRFQENRPTMGEILERIEEVMDEQEHQEQIASSKCCSNGSKDCCSLHKIIPDTWDSPGSNY
ncbi:hypothetical protein HN51_049331 [Arachis hypogaea]|uniref:Protein kinase domain-containing protein n=1 Tax=Arachis hypogaea TaxID=3818 RepID=A0A444YFC8_ARAHY|nr:probable inactive receptor kinase At2g26730 [Arachis ipaensis]XP_029150439.1 probable inactive receptor kinase At2g26730 [Arachis hypogaea]RYR00624.1 hypothetical protein Ahy_B07g088749 [Arachis hypogaea]